jgi:hypothetical protein
VRSGLASPRRRRDHLAKTRRPPRLAAAVPNTEDALTRAARIDSLRPSAALLHVPALRLPVDVGAGVAAVGWPRALAIAVLLRPHAHVLSCACVHDSWAAQANTKGLRAQKPKKRREVR